VVVLGKAGRINLTLRECLQVGRSEGCGGASFVHNGLEQRRCVLCGAKIPYWFGYVA
jgi:hypothetical protein